MLTETSPVIPVHSPDRRTALPYFQQTADAAPLVVFRLLFGLLMIISMIRFWSYGWIDKLYIQPQFFFSYYGFEWIQPLGEYTYGLFALCGVAATMVVLGYHYRVAIILFFLSFTYIELMDKTTYLNHYYLVSAISFLLIFLPAHRNFSLDAWWRPSRATTRVPRWSIDAIKLLIGIVYFYAGLAKLNTDWLLHAMPLKIWLSAHYDFPVLGYFFEQNWVHYAFSWSGMLYDLSIPFLLLYSRTRRAAFVLVVVFHVLTHALFPIGMFPYIMIVSALIFFDARWHRRILALLSQGLRLEKAAFSYKRAASTPRWKLGIVGLFFSVQLLLPFRYLLYPGELFWTEEGYRFSWRVMLMEKAGSATFRVVDSQSGQRLYVDNTNFLTTFQEKQMATQPDFIIQYAHHLADHYSLSGQRVQVYVDSYVALNGRASQPYVDPTVDLTQVQESFRSRTYLLPFNDHIRGL